MGVYEVTRGEFARFVSETGHDPVVCVNWKDAQAYVSWLSRMTDKTYRLLSEAEWEYVARAGTRTRYWYGDDKGADQLCTYGNGAAQETSFDWKNDACGDGYERTAPVGSFRSNSFGLHDVHGNVWEWVEDCWHDSYSGAPSDGRAWTSGGDCSLRVLRGGSWDNAPGNLRAAIRYRNDDVGRFYSVGFRVARTLSPLAP